MVRLRVEPDASAVCGWFSRAGIVLAVRGRENEGGMFEVSEVTFVNPSPLNKAPGKPMEVDSGSKYLAIVSGLSVGSQKTDFMAVRPFF